MIRYCPSSLSLNPDTTSGLVQESFGFSTPTISDSLRAPCMRVLSKFCTSTSITTVSSLKVQRYGPRF